MRIKRALEKMSVPLLSILIAMLAGSAVILVCGYSPIAAYSSLLRGAFGSFHSCMGTLEKCVPLIFCGLAAMAAFKSGIFNIGLEGQVVVGAIAYILTGLQTSFLPMPLHVLVCIASAMLAGGSWALIAGMMKVFCKANEVVSTIMLIAEGLVSVLMIGIFGSKGKSAMVASLSTIQIPVIKEIPVLNVLLSGYSGLAYLLAAVTVISWIVIYRMPIGIRLRAAGINDRVVDSLGLRSDLIKYVSVMVCGGLSALGGAFLSLSQLNFYSKDMVAGRGYIALAIFVFAKKNPVYCVWISILFGLTETIQLRMQAFPIPTQFLSMIPYLCTLIMLLFAAKDFKTQRKEHA